ncbi:hypothetical protein ACOMHN_050360 [Nucella lapillus]
MLPTDVASLYVVALNIIFFPPISVDGEERQGNGNNTSPDIAHQGGASEVVHACREFGLTACIKRTSVMGQDVAAPPSISIDKELLRVIDRFTYSCLPSPTTCRLTRK